MENCSSLCKNTVKHTHALSIIKLTDPSLFVLQPPDFRRADGGKRISEDLVCLRSCSPAGFTRAPLELKVPQGRLSVLPIRSEPKRFTHSLRSLTEQIRALCSLVCFLHSNTFESSHELPRAVLIILINILRFKKYINCYIFKYIL